MDYFLSTQNMMYWLSLLGKILAAHANSGTPLRADLKQTLDDNKTAYENLVTRYKSLRVQERQLRNQGAALQSEGITLLRRIRYTLLSQLAKETVPPVLQAYGLAHQIGSSRPEVLHHLRLASQAVGEQTDDACKLPQAMQQELATALTKLDGNLKALQAVRAEVADCKEKLRLAAAANMELRERAYAYLIAVLPNGRQDPKLIEYGLRDSLRTSRRQVVVPVEPEPVEPQPNPAP